MKIDNLIETSFKTISIIESKADLLDQLLIHGYLAVEGDDLAIKGIITLKDLQFYCSEQGVKNIDKPHIRPNNTIFEVREMMKTSGNDHLPVFDNKEFKGVISIGRITDRLISFIKQTQVNYQRVIHDLRNPIANIQGMIEIASEAENNEESRQILEMSAQSTKHAMDILDDLLFVEIDESRPLMLQPTEMNGFFIECIDEQQGLAFQKNIQITTTFTEKAVIRNIDRKQFKRAIQNIVSNAIKFSLPGSIVKVSSSVINDQIKLKIVDSGIGIPEYLQDAIFTKFSSAQRQGTNGEASTGLGLYFTKRCVQRHNGSITLKVKLERELSFMLPFELS